jgi:hypothetical protein
MAERAKRRSGSQKVGQVGELIFAAWAVDNGLNPHKSTLDLGIDYFCEHLKRIKPRVEEVTGIVLVTQVRATSRKSRPRVVVDREDVETALRMREPYCLVAVSLESKEVSFRFLDAELFEEWTAFLKSKKKSYSRYIEHMQAGSVEFAQGLRAVSRPAFRQVLEERKTQARLEMLLPDATFEVRGGPQGWTLVTVPTLLSIFHLDDTKAREHAMRIFFSPQPLSVSMELALQQLTLHEPFEAIADLAMGPMIVVGEGELPARLFVEWESERTESTFQLRRIHDERAYIGRSGLVLQVSDARTNKSTGRPYHSCSSSLQSEGALDLQSSGELSLLKLLRPGARINEVGKAGIEVETFQIQHLGDAVTALEKVFDALKIPLSQARLADFTHRDFAMKIGYLEALLDRNTDTPVIPTFVIGLPESVIIDEGNWRRGKYRVPIVTNLADYGVVVWIEGEADSYIYEGVIHGFRFRTTVLLSADATQPKHPNIAGIEAWIYKDWPAVPLTGRHAQTEKVRKEGALPFGGEFSNVKDDALPQDVRALERGEPRTGG